MSNTYFDFKQFRIEQGQCAMKVGTDGVMLGSWIGYRLRKNLIELGKEKIRILDIGSGTSLISLMVAQVLHELRQKKQIGDYQVTAVEIDRQSYLQGVENIVGSPWKNNVKAYNADIKEWIKENRTQEFDIVVSNPPFFEHSLKSFDDSKNKARHTDSLNLRDLFRSAYYAVGASTKANFKECFFLILPALEEENIRGISEEYGFVISSIQRVYTKIKVDKPERILASFSLKKLISEGIVCTEINSLSIHSEKGQYSSEYKNMVKDFYIDK